jgi:copper(I)-binding protein
MDHLMLLGIGREARAATDRYHSAMPARSLFRFPSAQPVKRIATLALLSLALAGQACAAEGCAPRVREGWIRLSPGPMQMMLAGFGRIENHCPAPAVVLGASSHAFADVSLHRTTGVDGISRMRPVPQLAIAPDGAVVFEPGALHLMLMQPAKPLNAGDHVEIDFRLQDGRRIQGDFVVRP